MANTVRDEIYQNFLQVSRQQAADLTQATQSLAGLIGQADAVRSDFAQQTAWKSGTSSGASTSSSGSGSGGLTAATGGGGSSILSTVFDVFKSGLGVSPVINGIMSLFGGGGTPAPAPLMKYVLPPAINFQAAEVNGGIANADYDQAGIARSYGAPAATAAPTMASEVAAAQTPLAQVAPAQMAPASQIPDGVNGRGLSASAPQITVNVQAMDARSFMDRSNEIALAVRDAMLNLNAINDVVGEL